jgi:LysM repeat protein
MGVEGLSLEKFEIIPKNDESNKLTACFNPNKLSLSYSATWSEQKKKLRNVQDLQFGNTESATLQVELMFDTYSGAMDVILEPSDEKNVEKLYIQKLVKLTRVSGDKHGPSICKVKWGKMTWGVDNGKSQNEFVCVLKQVSVTYLLFLSNGTPVRATANCDFTQWREKTEDIKALNAKSPDVYKRHIVRRGDTISSISAQYYNDSGYWRLIAEQNKLTNPRKLEPGTPLLIPILDERTRG